MGTRLWSELDDHDRRFWATLLVLYSLPSVRLETPALCRGWRALESNLLWRHPMVAVLLVAIYTTPHPMVTNFGHTPMVKFPFVKI